MTDDPIVAEVHRIREQILAEYNGDLRALIADAQRRTEEAARAGRQIISPSLLKTQPQPPPAKKAG